ncbi:MAG TPA: bifunctional adenosylcobinamide kinase/adenosylcobinamide-phosphate guanylyltransferase [Chloroflexota bacterium]|nr:bifunctional adenosylcobinamide kinase/adenosylcobinamide-phosphate guanylyltransferase [Chloroflexota bacterium]
MGELVLVLGGVRSGKSAFAERLAAAHGGPVLYVATGQAGDAEMAARIAAHRARRPATWATIEAPLDPVAAIAGAARAGQVVLLDCVGMLVSNVLLAEGEAGSAASRLDHALGGLLGLVRERHLHVIAVSGESGLGLLPLAPLGRRYLDLLGDANQRLAAAAGRTYLVIAGLGVDVRRLAWEPEGP